MIFEMACYRGTMVWLDGESSKTGWGCGINGNILSSNDLQIGSHRIEEIEVFGQEHDDCDPAIGSFYVFENAIMPKEIELRTTNGKWRGPITEVMIEDPNSGRTTVVLANGRNYDIDETTIYLRAILQPIN